MSAVAAGAYDYEWPIKAYAAIHAHDAELERRNALSGVYRDLFMFDDVRALRRDHASNSVKIAKWVDVAHANHTFDALEGLFAMMDDVQNFISEPPLAAHKAGNKLHELETRYQLPQYATESYLIGEVLNELSYGLKRVVTRADDGIDQAMDSVRSNDGIFDEHALIGENTKRFIAVYQSVSVFVTPPMQWKAHSQPFAA
jgi:hypothetical protein